MVKRKKREEKSKGEEIGKFPCSIDPSGDCISSDGMSIYIHEDSSHSAYCHVCQYGVRDFAYDGANKTSKREVEIVTEEEQEYFERIRDEYIPLDNKERKMRAEDYDLYGVKMEVASDGETIEKIFYPTYRDEVHVGYRIRERFQEWDKAVKKDPSKLGVLKKFSSIGDAKKGIQMFGQNVFPSGGDRLVITCGEEDTIAAYKMVATQTKFDGGYPTVSVPSGEDISWVKPNLIYISSFKNIYIIADKDKAGEKFLGEVCKILPAGKVNIVRLPKGPKDPSDMYKNEATSGGRKRSCKELYRALWNAKRYSPAGIKSFSEGWDDYCHRGEAPLIPFPESFGDLNRRTFGGYGADGEIVNVAGPSSVGKSLFIKEMIYTGLCETDKSFGVISLEETLPEFLEGMLSVHMSVQLNEIPFDERDREKELVAFQELLGINGNSEKKERIHFLDDPGGCKDEDELWEKINFLIKGLDCGVIVLDPVTLALSLGIDEDDFNSEVVKSVKRHKLAWINVHHVRKSQNGSKSNSEGAELSEEMIKGSGSHFQTGMVNLILTRNKVHDNDIIRNTTKIKLSKCRRHGKSTGIAGFVFYNGETGRLELGQDTEELEELLGSGDDNPLNSFGENDNPESY